jgi:hypothetical protein
MKKLKKIVLVLIFGFACNLFGQTAEPEKTLRIDLLSGRLEITAKNQKDERVISVRLGQRSLKEFKTYAGPWLDFLGTYSGVEAAYVVLRTNMGSGACVGTDVFVLRIKESNGNVPVVDVSPVLRKCMGEGPEVKFTVEGAQTIVTVAGSQWRSQGWVAERR